MPPKGERTQWTVISCAYCGIDYEIRNCYLKRPQIHCCSKSCNYYYRLENPEDMLGTQIRTGVKPKHKYSWHIDKGGYILFERGVYKKRLLHRIIVERKLGRRLLWEESVHHIDGNKSNNKICNLLLVTISEHKRIHDKLRAEARAGKGAVTCC